MKECSELLRKQIPALCCADCGRALTYCDATFWLYEEDTSWNIPLPVCLVCSTPVQRMTA